MTIIYYLPILAPFAALFALGYFPMVMVGRRLMKRRLVEASDGWAPVGGVLGTVVGYLAVGLNGLDRFALAPDRVRTAWMMSGLAFRYEMAQALFSGVVCALVMVILTRGHPDLSERVRIAAPVVALVVSAVDFTFWPILFAPFVY